MARYHVYDDARHPTGPVAAGHTLHVYDDAAGTVTSSIYAAASGGSPLTNPYTVPATGIVDFWATVPAPYAVAQGEATPRPLKILVATPEDIGAADLATDNDFQGQINAIPARGVFFGDPADIGAGTQIAQIGRDADTLYFQVGDGVYSAVAPYTFPDRFNIGTQPPFRIGMGETNSAGMSDPGVPFFYLHAVSSDPADTCFHLAYPPGQTGTVLRLADENDVEALAVNVDGDLTLRGDFLPSAGGVGRFGNAGRAASKLYLSDGVNHWAVTVNAAGTLAATRCAENYLLAPSFELDTVMPPGAPSGLAAYWGLTHTTTTAPTPTLVTGRTKGLAQRIQYTGVAGDTAAEWQLTAAATPAASFAEGENVAISGYAKVADGSAVVTLVLVWLNAAGGFINAMIVPLTNTETWHRYLDAYACPALTDHIQVYVHAEGIDNGNVVDVTVDDIQPEKAAAATAYFDGSYPPAEWDGPANASYSRKG